MRRDKVKLFDHIAEDLNGRRICGFFGKVTDAAGSPIAGATVSFTFAPFQGLKNLFIGQTAEDGTFRFDGVPPGIPIWDQSGTIAAQAGQTVTLVR